MNVPGTAYAETVASRLRAESETLARRWLERLDDLLAVERERIFPTDALLNHVPHLIQEIATYVEAPAIEELAANTSVVTKARELGLLRHAQQASVHQLLREYHLLGAILETFLQEETERVEPTPVAQEILTVAARIAYALRVLQQTTIDTFIAEYTDRIAAQQSRLESFNRLVSHELRQPLGTLQFAARALSAPAIAGDPERRARLIENIDRNVTGLVQLTQQLERIAGLSATGDDPSRQEIHLSTLTREVARQLREMADLRGVEIRVSDDLPTVVTDTARLDLALMNLLSNGIKYADPDKPERYVEVFLSGATEDGRTICIRDNGLGIPRDALPRIFDGFYRAHSARDEELDVRGSGLGLAIVAECVEAIGGRITVASVEGEGTAFDLWLPESPPAGNAPGVDPAANGRR